MWRQAQGAPPYPAPTAAVANHLAELAAAGSAIVSAHALLRLPFDKRDPELRATLAGIAKAHGVRPRRQAAPLLAADAIRIAAVCGGDLRGERDRALILLGFAGAFRRSELVALQVADLEEVADGYRVKIGRAHV